MMHQIKPIYLVFFLTILSGCAHSNKNPPQKTIAIHHEGNMLHVSTRDNTYQIKLQHTVDGFNVSCSMEHIIAWGKPAKINESNPQDSSLTIIRLQPSTTVSTAHFDKGIHIVEYIKDQRKAIAWTTFGASVDLDTGNTTIPATEAEINAPKEDCATFKNKSYQKYK